MIAEVSDIKENELNKIVCIPNADPDLTGSFLVLFLGWSQLGEEQIHTWQLSWRTLDASTIGVGLPKKVTAGRVHLDCKGKRIEVLS